MSLVTQKALPSCCASWTLSCCRSFGSSSGHNAAAAAQAKVKSQPAYRQGRTNFTPIGSNFQRDTPPRTSTSNPQARFDPSKPFDFRRQNQYNRSGSNNVGTPDSGWATRRTNVNQNTNQNLSVPQKNRTIGRREDASSNGTRQSQRLPLLGTSVDQEKRDQPLSYAMNDMPSVANVVKGKGMDARFRDKEKNREREMNAHNLHVEKEILQQRSKIARQVLKGVAKLPQIRKMRDVFLPKHVSVLQLARLLNIRLERLQTALHKAGMTEVSYDHLLNSEDAALIAPEFGCNAIIDETAAFDIYPPPLPKDISSLPHRPPVVTIMGHVDHGKTTLLDTLRSASVAEGEAGGITQHIGAFSLPVSSLSTSKEVAANDGRMITFLDTPGHAAFSAMRARGAMVTDVIVLVVAADDGVMPQTREVINLVKKEQGRVGLVVAINKIDKPGADADTVRRMLLAEGVQLEEFGGDVPSVEVSGLTGKGLDNLMETVSLVAELMDIRAERQGTAVGYVLESKNLKGFGPVATVLLLRGEMTTGSHLIAGQVQSRVRTLTDSSGKLVKSVLPGMAVSVSGWKDLPNAGDEVIQATEDEIKRAIVNRKRNHDLANLVEDVEAINEKRRMERERREEELETAKAALEKGQALPSKPLMRPEVNSSEDGPCLLKLIIKADVSGSAEAVAGALEGIGNDKAKTKIIQYSVGNVTEGDIVMAKATGASIIAFGVQSPRSIAQLAHGQGVEIISSDIIYRLMESVREKVAGLLPPVIEYRVTGEANIQEVFEIDLKGRKVLKVAGCRVGNGVLEKTKSIRLIRGGEIIYTGNLDTFRHLKKDITEAKKGMECGLSLSKYSGDFLPGDVLQSYDTITKAAIL